MLTNLDNCVDLLLITFNAVDGFSAQAKVQELNNRFIDAMNKSNATSLDFKLATADALEAYVNAYGNLFYGEVDIAIILLADTKSIATRMVKKADDRINKIDQVLDGKAYKEGANNGTADQSDPDTQKTYDELHKEKEDLVDKKRELNEKLNSLKGQKSTLSNALKGFGAAMDKVAEDTRNHAREVQKTAGSRLPAGNQIVLDEYRNILR